MRHAPLRRLLVAAKIVLGALLGLAVLATIAFFAAYGYLERMATPERLRATITEGLGRALGRPVKVSGAIVTPRGLRIRGLVVYASEGGAPIFRSRSALVTVSVSSLLRERRIRFATLALDGPDLNWPAGGWKRSQGATESGPFTAASQRLAGLPVVWSVERVRVDNGAARFQSREGGSVFNITNLRFVAGPFRASGRLPFDWSSDFEWRDEGIRLEAGGRGKGVIDAPALDWRRMSIEGRDMVLRVAGAGDFKGSAKLQGFPDPVISLEAESPAFSVNLPRGWLGRANRAAFPPASWIGQAQWRDKVLRVDRLTARFPQAQLQGKGLLDDSGDTLRWRGHAEMETASVKSLAALVSPPFRGIVDGSARFSATLMGEGPRWSVPSASLEWDGARLATPDFDVLRADVKARSQDHLATIDWSVSKGTVRWLDELFRGIRGTAVLKGRSLSVEGLHFRWGRAAARLAGRLMGLPRTSRIAVTGLIDRLDWEKAASLAERIVEHFGSPRANPYLGAGDEDEAWVKAFKYSLPRSFPALSGDLRISNIGGKDFSIDRAALRWSMAGLTPALRALNGSLAATLGPGRVGDIKSVQESSKILKILFLPYIYMYRLNHLAIFNAATAYPRGFAFSRIGADYIVRRGRVDSRYFYVQSPEFTAFADGSADLANETVDLRVLTQLTHYRAPLPEYLVDEEGRPAISFRVRGNLNHPNIDLDLKKMGAHEVEGAIARVKRGARSASRRRSSP